MKIILKKSFRENIYSLMRRLGYHESRSRFSNSLNFTRNISRTFYPRFHLYVDNLSEKELILNLHLDQKKPSYPGSHAHSGEHDTEIVMKEGERIKEILAKL